MQVSVTGLPWYRSVEDYDQVRAISADAEGFHDTYGEWLIHAEQVEKFWQAQGCRTVRAHLNPTDFGKWCAERSLDVDAQARAAFAAELAGRVVINQHPE